jgi:hypothetical protein
MVWHGMQRVCQDGKDRFPSPVTVITSQAAALREATARADASQKQVLLLEGELAALQESHRVLLQGKNEVEGGMLEGGLGEGREQQHRPCHSSRSQQMLCQNAVLAAARCVVP